MRKTYDWGKIKWAVLTMFTAAFMFFAVSMECFAAEGTVTAGSAKIRASASTSSDHVSSAKSGEKFTIIGQENGTDGKVWYKINYNGDKVGYIRSDLMSVSGDVPAEEPATYNPTVAVTELTPVSAKVTGSSVRVRPDAAASGGVVTSVVRDTVLTIDGMATGSDGKTWYRVNCTVSGEAVLGFVREDFVSVQGELTPSTGEVTPQTPVEPEVPQDTTPSAPVATQEPKVYETIYENDKWYLLNNDKNEKYIIEDVFSAVNRNHELATKYEKTAGTQKVFLWILSILLVLCVAAIGLLVWKLKDMMDDAFFKQVERKTLRERESAPKKVMHTIGDEKKTGNTMQRKPGQSGQQGKTMQGQKNPQRPAGEAVRKPAGQARPQGEAPRKVVSRPEGERPVNKQTPPQRQQGETVKKPVTGNPTPAKQSQPGAKAPQAQPQKQAAKPQGFQSKNFMADEDEFEFEFLNWDGVEDE